jgi:hypothetical protein
VRKTALLALAAALFSCCVARADDATRLKVARYFEGWYPYLPGSQVAAVEAREIALPGLETYRVERQAGSKARESNYVFYDRARDEIFVGDVLHDPERAAAKRPFDGARDLPPLQASLREAFGVPVAITLEPRARGELRPIRVSMQEEKDAIAVRHGFVTENGATALLGEFQPLSESPAAFRERLLRQRPGIRTGSGRFSVTEFLDFQCERCRRRTPEVRRTVEESGGTVEVRLLPIVKQHEAAFVAAELAAALADVSPQLYAKYEQGVFARESIDAAAARELARDVADSAGAREKFEAALSSGRARRRVAEDLELAMRLGVSGTPTFVSRGTLVPGERWIVEGYLWQTGQIARPKASSPPPAR